MVKDIDTEISRSIISMLLSEPFFAHLLGTVIRRSTDRIGTAAVFAAGSRIEILVNPSFFMEELKNAEERIAVIKHETLHLLFKHLFRFDKKRHHPIVFNIACDLVVNQYVEPRWKLPPSALRLSSFPDLNFETEQDTEYYYDILISLFETKMEEILNRFHSIVTMDASAAEKIRRFILLHFKLIEEDQNLAEVFQVELRQSAKFLKDYHNQKFIDYLNIIGDILYEGQASGIFRSDFRINTQKLAIFGAVDEIARQWILHAEPKFSLKDTALELADTIIKGLLPSQEKTL